MPVYLDHNATTPMHREVLEAMQPWFRERVGNASGLHGPGREARRAVEAAREQVAGLIGASPEETCFTSGGTESDNLAVRGGIASLPAGAHLVTTSIEHPAVLNCAGALEDERVRVERVQPGSGGAVRADDVVAAAGEEPCLVSIMHANNETGVVQPVAEVGAALRAGPAMLHVDAVQSAGRLPLDVAALGVDLLTLSSHKMYGPQGVGALYIRKGVDLVPMVHGGGQEEGLRPGTYNVAGIVGFGHAAMLAQRSLIEGAGYVEAMRDTLEEGILKLAPDAVVIGQGQPRLCNTINVAFPGRDGHALAANLDMLGIAVSTGSACTAGSDSLSHVHEAMGLPARVASGAIRLSLGESTGEAEVEETLAALEHVLGKRRKRGGLLRSAVDTLFDKRGAE